MFPARNKTRYKMKTLFKRFKEVFPMLKILIAYVAGKTIEQKLKRDTVYWHTAKKPIWDFYSYVHRVKKG